MKTPEWWLEQPSYASWIATREDIQSLYYELLWAVASKFPGETRHQTALRYIRQAEEHHGSGDQEDIGEAMAKVESILQPAKEQ